MLSHHEISKLKIQPHVVAGSDISCSKATFVNVGLNRYILKVVYFNHILFLWQTWLLSIIKGFVGRKDIKSVHFGPKSKTNIYHNLWYILGSYFVSYCMWRLFIYFKEGRVLKYIRITSIQEYLDWVESQMDLDTN